MASCYINTAYYQQLPTQRTMQPRARFTRCYDDLSKLENTEAYAKGVYYSDLQYNYVELGDSVLSEYTQYNSLSDLDLFVVCYWSHEYDPTHACGAYFCDRYGIGHGTRTFDVCDQGILSPITAINIIKAYFSVGKANNALLLCVDQPTIPVPEDYSGCKPNKASALLVDISAHKKQQSQLRCDEIKWNDKSTRRNGKPTIELFLDPTSMNDISCPGLLQRILADPLQKNGSVDWHLSDSESKNQVRLSGHYY